MSRNISLTEKKQIALIQNGNHNEILQFIWANTAFRFTGSASQVFVERGNSEEILAYIATRPLPERGELALLKRGMPQEILTYVKVFLLMNFNCIAMSINLRVMIFVRNYFFCKIINFKS